MSKDTTTPRKRGWAFLDKDWERPLLLVFYCYIVGVIAVEVVRRFVFSYSSVWGEETARYAFVYLVWVGAAAAARERAHIRIDIIFQFLPRTARGWLWVFGDIVTIIFGLFVLYYSLESMRASLRFDALTSGLRINQAWFTFAVPFGFSLILLRLSQSVYRDIGDLLAGRPLREGRKLFS